MFQVDSYVNALCRAQDCVYAAGKSGYLVKVAELQK
jgi:hypothetical protein